MNYGNKEEVAHAHAAIQEIRANRTPSLFYGATTLFMQIVHDFAVNNRATLGVRKYQELIDFELAHAPIAEENMMRQAGALANAAAAAPADEEGAAAVPPEETTTPDPMRAVRQVASQVS